MRAALLFAAATATALAAEPQFAQEFSAFIVSDLVQNQGTYELPNGDLCCADGSMDCQVQIQSQGGMVYNSLSRNATTQVFGADYTPYAIVTLFNLNKEIAVDANFNCQSFCPNGREVLTPFGVDGYTDAGAGSVCTESNGCFNGEQWIDTTTFLNITMETDSFWVNQTSMTNAIPIIDIDTLTPFGEYVGQSNTTYTQWTPGPQPASMFTVNGLTGCQKSTQCGSNVRQLHRLATGKKNLWLQSHLATKVAKAQAQLEAAQAHQDALAAARA